MTSVTCVAFVVVVGILHWLVGGYLIFIGTVVDPQPGHVACNQVGFLMLLPFSALWFVEPFAEFHAVLGAMSGLLWGYVYFLLLRKLVRRASARAVGSAALPPPG